MPSIRCPTVSVEIPAALGVGVIAEVRGWSPGENATPGMATLYLPALRAASRTSVCGDWVYVFFDTTLVFAGTVQQVSQALDPEDEAVEVVVFDARHEMARRVIGQYGTGAVATLGGWAGVGYDVVFNRDGKPNRSVAKAANGAYTFDLNPTTAQYWTYADALEFVLVNYVDTTTCDYADADLIGALTGDALECDVSCDDARDAVDRITRQVGAQWDLRYVGTLGGGATTYQILYTPLIPGAAARATHRVYLDALNTHTSPQRTTVGDVRLTQSVLRSFDRVEVHSDRKVVDATYSDVGLFALLTKVSAAADMPPDALCYYTVDVTMYSLAELGSDLTAGSAPKPWLSHLGTRRNSAGYLTAAQVTAAPDLGEPVSARDCIWLSQNAGTTFTRVHSGVRVDFDAMRLYVMRKVSLYGATGDAEHETYELDDASVLRVRFSVATVLEHPLVSSTLAASEYLANPRTRKVQRRDLTPLYRYNVVLPDLTSADPSAVVTAAVALETYCDVAAALLAHRTNVWNMRTEVETIARFRLPFFPRLARGDAVILEPANLGQPATMRILDLDYDADDMDVVVTASNNWDGLA